MIFTDPQIVNKQEVNKTEELILENIKKVIDKKLNKELIDNYTNPKTSNKKILASLTKELKQEAVLAVAETLRSNSNMNELSFNKIKEVINNADFEANFDSKLKKNISEYKKKAKLISGEIKSYYTRIKTDKNNEFYINDDEEISSKKLSLELEELKKEYLELKNNLDASAKYALNLKIAADFFKVVTIGLGMASAALYIAAPFFAPALPVAIGLTSVAAITGSIAATLSISAKSNLNSITKMDNITTWDIAKLFATLISMPYKTIIASAGSATALKNSVGLLRNAKNMYYIAKYVKGTVDLTEMVTGLDNFVGYKLKIDSFYFKLKLLKDRIDKIKELEWVVVNELPLDNPYYLKGVGGDNTHFKNLKTGEIKTLEEMLSYDDIKLYSWNLQRVHGKNGDYIRSLPNKTKEDNLG